MCRGGGSDYGKNLFMQRVKVGCKHRILDFTQPLQLKNEKAESTLAAFLSFTLLASLLACQNRYLHTIAPSSLAPVARTTVCSHAWYSFLTLCSRSACVGKKESRSHSDQTQILNRIAQKVCKLNRMMQRFAKTRFSFISQPTSFAVNSLWT